MKNLFFLVVFGCMCISSFSQPTNLIPNGSFEAINCDSIRNTMIQAAYPWEGPAVDLYCIKNESECDAPWRDKVKAMPFEGANLIGFQFNANGHKGDIVSVRLSPALTAGRKYRLRFAYLPNENKYPKNITLKFCFSTNRDIDGNEPMLVNDTLYCTEFHPEQGNKSWHIFEVDYTANGMEAYFWLMNAMKSDKDRVYYFFLDDFSLVTPEVTKTIR